MVHEQISGQSLTSLSLGSGVAASGAGASRPDQPGAVQLPLWGDEHGLAAGEAPTGPQLAVGRPSNRELWEDALLLEGERQHAGWWTAAQPAGPAMAQQHSGGLGAPSADIPAAPPAAPTRSGVPSRREGTPDERPPASHAAAPEGSNGSPASTGAQAIRDGLELSRGRRGVVFALGQKAVEALRASWAGAGVYGGIIRQNIDEHGMRRGLSAGMQAAAYHFMEWDRPGGGRPTRQEVANNVAASLQDLGEVAARAFQRAHGYLENRADRGSTLATATLQAGRMALRASGFVASNVRQGAQRKQQADAAAAPTSENLPEA